MNFMFASLKNLKKHEFHFLQQAAGGPTGWGQRGPVGPPRLVMDQNNVLQLSWDIEFRPKYRDCDYEEKNCSRF